MMVAFTAEILFGVDTEDNWYHSSLYFSGNCLRKHLHSSEPPLPLGWGTFLSVWQDLSHIIRQLITDSLQVLIHRLITHQEKLLFMSYILAMRKGKEADLGFRLQLITFLQMIDGFTRQFNFKMIFSPFSNKQIEGALQHKLRNGSFPAVPFVISIAGASVWIEAWMVSKYVFT